MFRFTRRFEGVEEATEPPVWFLEFAVSADGRLMIEGLLQGRESDAGLSMQEMREAVQNIPESD